jgi:hypothetical protein
MQVPKNIISTKQYTAGNQYFIKGTRTPYKGNFFIINGNAFTGNELTKDSKPLENIKDSLLKDALKNAKNALKKHTFHPSTSSVSNHQTTRYFVKKTNETPIKISEIDKNTYLIFQKEPGYQTLILPWSMLGNNDDQINQADQTFNGIKLFLQDKTNP